MVWEVLGRIWRLQRALREEAERGLASLGLSGLEAWLLWVLKRHPYPSEAARRMGLPLPTVSHMLRRLEEGGFVARSLDKADLRRFAFRLTDKGEEAFRRAEALMEEALGRRLARLRPDEVQHLLTLLAKLEET
ncbi:MAG: MarR family transcriptional regulator [Thermus sp.]|uniref:MarR family winged helix-turn-helix transcriptional regulator n=1 Tax=Thermus sp. TaxID=275 RepID=UPI0025DE0C46|nr:MarR family transcriptional regulator [Thermus sp.]MCS7218560.1 MarR family transcriptional regulator [Thermus sp.]